MCNVCLLPEALVNVSGNYSDTVVVIKFGYMRETLVRVAYTNARQHRTQSNNYAMQTIRRKDSVLVKKYGINKQDKKNSRAHWALSDRLY